jgi:NAD(P)-dependent dehydrogenase (short-subunit alcohol dehydrogenase family)
VIASCSLVRASRHDLIVEACLKGDESAACEFATQNAARYAYACSKRAIACWVRQQAPTPDWAGAGIPINAIAPGIVRTVMTDSLLETGLAHTLVPMPLHGPATAEQAAALLSWLTGPENAVTTGQVIFFDGGFDALTRGADVW